jgi:hypothetical protein
MKLMRRGTPWNKPQKPPNVIGQDERAVRTSTSHVSSGASEHIWLTKRRLQSDYMQDIERQPMAASLQHDQRADGSINDYKKPTNQCNQRNNNDDNHQQQEAVSTTSKGDEERKNGMTQH